MAAAPADAIGVKLSTPRRGCSGLAYSVDYVTEEAKFDEKIVTPGGTFYIFPKALEDDAVAFCMQAKEYDLILVPSDSFGVPGYFRMAYCIDTEKVKRSIPVLEKFAHEVYGL